MRRFTLLFALVAVLDLPAVSAERRGGLVRPKSAVPKTLRQPVVADNKAAPKATKNSPVVTASSTQAAVGGVLALIAYQKVVAEIFKATKVKFPAMLGACMSLFAILLGTESVNPSLANSMFDKLTPGASLLAKWLPMFFVPALTLLPLSPPIGSGTEIAKVLLTVIVGWVFSLITTGFVVLFLRKAQGSLSSGSVAKLPVTAGKPFREETLSFFAKAFGITGVVSLIATRTGFEYAQPLQTVFITCFTVALYVFAARLPTEFVKLVHPLVTTSAGLSIMIRFWGFLTDQDYKNILRSYKVGSLSPLKTGSGDIMLFALGPSVVSFATAMYGRRALLKANFLVVSTAVSVASVGSLFGTAAFVRAISLGGKLIRLSMIPRCVTTALAMVVASMLGGDVSIAAAVVSMTGIIGATYARTVLDQLKITDPVTRGLAVGASSQGLGVASLAGEPDAFPFAAMAMVLCAIVSTTLVSVPAVKDAIIKLAGGV
mmetsp:Transcript_23145/g.44079  ORF Transcript_23145/g.44079 Transcript_23145/m.44079 type:complete len:488 (-) Transcript_23145:31-1494(-)|eukprot:scaffold42446_cov191-Amphora_coffeaeformis.AAC.3